MARMQAASAKRSLPGWSAKSRNILPVGSVMLLSSSVKSAAAIIWREPSDEMRGPDK